MKQQQQPPPAYLNSRDAAHLIGIKPRTLRKWRSIELLKRNIHYVKPSTKSILYHRELLLDFVANIERPKQHQKAIETYIEKRL